MSNQFAQLHVTPSESELVNTFIDAMSRVYLWMTGGLLITASVAAFVASSDDMADLLFSSSFLLWAIIIAQFGLVIAISAAINKMSPTMALGLFFLYSGLMGVTLSVVFLAYDLGTVAIAFGVTTGTFAALSFVGLTTKKDLTK